VCLSEGCNGRHQAGERGAAREPIGTGTGRRDGPAPADLPGRDRAGTLVGCPGRDRGRGHVVQAAALSVTADGEPEVPLAVKPSATDAPAASDGL